MRRLGQAGFTLPELLVAVLLVLIIIGSGLLLARPKSYVTQQRDAERLVNIAQLMQAVRAYANQTGSLPPGITRTMQPIGTLKGQVNLCSALVPHYLKALPDDPLIGRPVKCTPNQQYVTGYAIQSTGKGNQVTIAALSSETKLVYLTD